MDTHTLTQPRAGRGVAAPALTQPSRWALPVLLSGTFMVVLDFFIVNVALPAIQGDLGASDGALEWVVAGFALTSAVFLISSGRLGDRFGRRRVFTFGLALFTLSSALCGLAWGPAALVVGRLAQGVSAALLMPNILSIITVTYEGSERVRALKAYALTMGLAAVSGQLIGGLLVRADVLGLGWRSCFLINIPIGAAALVLTPMAIAESRGRASGLDPIGTLLVTAGLTAILLPLVQGREQGWPTWTWISIGVAAVLLLGFLAHQRRSQQPGGAPLLDLSLFRSRSFSAGLATQFAFWCGQPSFFLVLALYLQQGRGLSALEAGLVFTVLAISYVVASTIAPPLAERHGRRVLGVGAATLAGGHGVLLAGVAEAGLHGSVAFLVPGLLLVGAGMGMLIAPLTTIILSGVEPHRVGSASGVLATVQNVGSALGVALIGVVFFGVLHGGFAHAFQLCLALLGGLIVAVGVLTRFLPGPARTA
jgi:EmrB/QacA subfamily drug resistance transporter